MTESRQTLILERKICLPRRPRAHPGDRKDAILEGQVMEDRLLEEQEIVRLRILIIEHHLPNLSFAPVDG